MGQLTLEYHAGQYHRCDVTERSPEHPHSPHIASFECWCGVTITPLGYDLADRPLTLIDHILNPVEAEGWQQANPEAGTGPFSLDWEGTDEPLIEVVQSTHFILPAQTLADARRLFPHLSPVSSDDNPEGPLC